MAILWVAQWSGGVAPPVGDFSQAFSAGMLEESDFVAGMLEFVDIGPDLGLPRSLVGRGLSATGTAGVKDHALPRRSLHVLQFQENAAYFFDLFVGTQNVFVTQQVSKAEFAGFDFRFLAGVERPIFGSQLLGRVASHPESIFVSHTYLGVGFGRWSWEQTKQSKRIQQ
jgi:hypothetical protein